MARSGRGLPLASIGASAGSIQSNATDVTATGSLSLGASATALGAARGTAVATATGSLSLSASTVPALVGASGAVVYVRTSPVYSSRVSSFVPGDPLPEIGRDGVACQDSDLAGIVAASEAAGVFLDFSAFPFTPVLWPGADRLPFAPPRINLIKNPSADYGTTTGYGSNGPATIFTVDSTRAHSGTKSFKITGDGVTPCQPVYSMQPIQPGPFAASVYYNIPVALSKVVYTVIVYFWDAAVTYKGVIVAPSIPAGTTTDGWVRSSMSGVAPPGTTQFYWVFVNAVVLGAGESFWIDDLLLESGSALLPYFDGDTPDTRDVTHAWTGAPGASASIAVSTAVVSA